MTCCRTGSCAQSDDFEQVRQTLQEADAVILSSPTYAAAPSARMKNMLDRLGMFEYMTSSVFGGKYIATISTAASFGAKDTVDYLAKAAVGGVFERTYVSGKLPVLLKGRQIDGLADEVRRARKLGARLVEDCQRNRKYVFQDVFARLLNAAMMRPLMAKAISEHRDTHMGGVYRNLTERGLIG